MFIRSEILHPYIFASNLQEFYPGPQKTPFISACLHKKQLLPNPPLVDSNTLFQAKTMLLLLTSYSGRKGSWLNACSWALRAVFQEQNRLCEIMTLVSCANDCDLEFLAFVSSRELDETKCLSNNPNCTKQSVDTILKMYNE